jgi:putative transposase
VIAGANAHDSKLLEATIEAVVVDRPESAQRLGVDRGYDNPTGRSAVKAARYRLYVQGSLRIKGEGPGRTPKPRRWVVERTLAWLSKCRGLLVRYEKHASNCLGLIQLACGLLWFRRLHQLGAV